MITREELIEELDYDSETGNFYRNKNGKLAGSKCKFQGYISISVLNKRYKAHRLAWLYVFGKFPENQIDHINHNRADNRIKNLRVTSHLENSKNQSMPKNNTSGQIGVNWSKSTKKWEVRIMCNGKREGLGFFSSFSDACFKYKERACELEFHKNHGGV